MFAYIIFRQMTSLWRSSMHIIFTLIEDISQDDQISFLCLISSLGWPGFIEL